MSAHSPRPVQRGYPYANGAGRAPRGVGIVAGGATLAIVVLLVALVAVAQAGPPSVWSSAKALPVLEGAAFVTDIDMAPDGTIWYTELAGNVSRLDPTTGVTEMMHQVPNVVTGRERGLVGLALAHDFEETGAFYLYYSERTEDPDGGTNHLVRVVDGVEDRLVSLSAAPEHNGGRIVVAPDGTLFVGTGENSLHDPAQDPRSLLGKVLHLTSNGDPVEGNLDGLVYSLGHRNVYGLALDPETGALWAAENMGWRRDEINIIEPGGNYGYPECEGHGLHGVDEPCPTDKNYTFPIMTFYEDRAAAPTGAAFWRGGFYWASFNEGTIHHIWRGGEAEEWRDEVVYEHDGRVVDLLAAPDGDLYFSAPDGIWHLGFGAAAVDDDPGPQGGGEEGAARTIASAHVVLTIGAIGAVAVAKRRPREI